MKAQSSADSSAAVLRRWDPLVAVDCHTTDRACHEETVTWSWPVNPNGDTPLLEFQRRKMFPAVNAIMKDKYKTPALGYGMFKDFRAPEKGWATFEPQPRFVTNYIGLRNRISLLDENYVHADFKTRVAGNLAFLKAVLDFTAAHAGRNPPPDLGSGPEYRLPRTCPRKRATVSA